MSGRSRLWPPSTTTLPATVFVYAEETDVAARHLAVRRGFVEDRWFSTMVRDLALEIPEIEITTGEPASVIELVQYAPAWKEATRLARNDAFRDHWGSLETPRRAVVAVRRRSAPAPRPLVDRRRRRPCRRARARLGQRGRLGGPGLLERLRRPHRRDARSARPSPGARGDHGAAAVGACRGPRQGRAGCRHREPDGREQPVRPARLHAHRAVGGARLARLRLARTAGNSMSTTGRVLYPRSDAVALGFGPASARPGTWGSFQRHGGALRSMS